MKRILSDTCYLVMKKASPRYKEGRNGLHITAMKQDKPSLKADEIAIEVVVKVPSTLFEDVTPKATIVVPGDYEPLREIDVEVKDPDDHE